jgi:uncharacterized protein (DUF2062 family)
MLRDRFGLLKWVEEPPHRTALAFALGVFLAISPLLGLHTVLGLLFAWLLRLNKVVTLTGVYVTNPWTIVPIYTFCTWVGSLILGVELLAMDLDWQGLTLGKIARELEHILMPFVVGSTVVAVAAAFISYFVVLKSVRGSRVALEASAPLSSESSRIPAHPGASHAAEDPGEPGPFEVEPPDSLGGGHGAGAPGKEG